MCFSLVYIGGSQREGDQDFGRPQDIIGAALNSTQRRGKRCNNLQPPSVVCEKPRERCATTAGGGAPASGGCELEAVRRAQRLWALLLLMILLSASVPIFIGWFEAGASFADFLRKSFGPLSERHGPVRWAVRGKRGSLGGRKFGPPIRKLGPLEAPVSTRHPKAPTEDRNTAQCSPIRTSWPSSAPVIQPKLNP